MIYTTTNLKKVLANFGNGIWGEEANEHNGYPILRSTNIHNGNLVLDNVAFRKVSKKSKGKYRLETGDIIVTSSSGSKHLIGKNAYFTVPEDNKVYLFSNFTYRLKPNKDLIEPKYLYYYLNSKTAKNFLERIQSTTSGLRNLNTKLYIEQEIPLPTPSEQKRIVEILDQGDALRKKRAQADKIAERIIPALFYKIFGDPVANPMDWDKMTLEQAEGQVRYGLGQPPRLVEIGVPMIRATNIDHGNISDKDIIYVDSKDVPKSRNAFLKANEVIVVRSGAYTGDVAQVTKKWENSVVGYDLVVTPGKRFCGEYIESYLLSGFIQNYYFKNIKMRAGQPHLNAQQLLNTPFLVPPVNLQETFADVINKLRDKKIKRKISRDSLETLFIVLQTKAFSGELTAKWREAHMKELLQEMEIQARYLNEAKI
ncbi:restriction endonuclease subunit S [candidate division KSB1 bacterium]|nr:restriction endonuclease subunit S [candidate division KSB1 bacterium]